LIRALLFDFDGLLVDTETADHRAWQETYGEHGVELALERWAQAIGTLGGFDPLAHLEELVGAPVDREAVLAAKSRRSRALAHAEPFRPGVLDYLAEARARGLHVAIVSSASDWWIREHLERLETADGWACIVCANGDEARAKPLPDLYVEALETLGAGPHEAVAFEDSPNGIAAAKAAGIFTVAVPNATTAGLDVSAADMVVASLEEVPLPMLLATLDPA
jgi:HAD superfamily hydrolase (TIGR01509 family)